ncbi:hypothetical protein [Salinarchaeum sp. Harcht-Bsk1]|nr:hypothetical protein [Salinarchaeum sp. Harcht-Bsk1]
MYAKDVGEFAGSASDDDAPLGERLRGIAGDLDLDTVEAIRDVRD